MGDLIETTLKTWRQEQYSGEDAPLLVNQQYVLFDEYYYWPEEEGWPQFV